MDNIKNFDLNIEKILENWEIFHAIREIIANALDEQILTNTKDIKIYKSSDNCWHIVDFGRGLNYYHLTQNENQEKLQNEALIGKFGVGLKDALATLYRHNIKIKIISKFGIFTLSQSSKIGFDDIITLHVNIQNPLNVNMVGTDFSLEGCSDLDIDKAKALFLKFSDSKILETTKYGQVIKKEGQAAYIYINGVKVSEESEFLFSYNITSLTTKLKKSLNRERTNVGRTAYTDRIKAILLECGNTEVIENLIDDLQNFEHGENHDELDWYDVQLYAAKKFNDFDKNVTFVTSQDLYDSPDVIDLMQRNEKNIVVVPSNLSDKLNTFNQGADEGETFTTFNQYLSDEQSNFRPVIININELTDIEKATYLKTDTIMNLIGGKPEMVKEILIVEKMYEFSDDLNGLWDSDENKIFIKRSTLSSLSEYAGTLLHECVHAFSGEGDVNRNFELKLTEVIGILASKLMNNK